MNILFICKGNWFRSQIAEAIYNQLTGTNDASSAGTYTKEPEGIRLTDLMPEPFFKTMASHGLDLRSKKTRHLTPEMLVDADIVISMAQEPFIPLFLQSDSRVIWWDVSDTNVVDAEIVEKTYQKIHALVEQLINSRRVHIRTT